MKKQYLTVLFTLICVLAFGLGALAQDRDTIVANVPYDFVASGAVLPAGIYTISVDDAGRRELSIKSSETGAVVFVLPTMFAYAPGKNAQLSLEPVGNKYFLTAIQMSDGVYTVTVPRSAIKLGQIQQQNVSPSGSN